MVVSEMEPLPGTKKWLHRLYSTDEQCLARDVQALKEWMAKQPHIPPAPDGCKMLFFLPGHNNDGSKVAVFKPLSSERGDHLDLVSTIKRCVMHLDLCLKNGVDFSSLHIIIDASSVKLAHLVAAFNPQGIRALTLSMKAYPVRVAQVNVVNVTPNIERMVAFFRPFLSAKIMSRVVVHREPQILFKDISKNTLPKDYGGDGPSLEELNVMSKEQLGSEKHYFDLCDSWKTDEKRRIGKSQYTNTDLSDIGSFRQLSVD
ncbi:hypothetical protein LSTR_LSTR005356 [Laodelphax striatellus]|uniref:CRAL-TRIO domain-containing protein n=1 Tax=Laodelphax striatellus TaxID=195883 RepID=A0A482WWF2_LAOST|nr:hypothetical protein LSTR_LSTR005356 [Laodelphax striatellus]